MSCEYRFQLMCHSWVAHHLNSFFPSDMVPLMPPILPISQEERAESHHTALALLWVLSRGSKWCFGDTECLSPNSQCRVSEYSKEMQLQPVSPALWLTGFSLSVLTTRRKRRAVWSYISYNTQEILHTADCREKQCELREFYNLQLIIVWTQLLYQCSLEQHSMHGETYRGTWRMELGREMRCLIAARRDLVGDDLFL